MCGRIKNMIIIAGQNFYPQDIEQTVAEASEHVRPGQVVACSNAALTEEDRDVRRGAMGGQVLG